MQRRNTKMKIRVRLFAPAGPPRDVVMKPNGELARAPNSAEIKKRFEDMGPVARPGSPEEFGAFLLSKMTRWKAVLAKKP